MTAVKQTAFTLFSIVAFAFLLTAACAKIFYKDCSRFIKSS